MAREVGVSRLTAFPLQTNTSAAATWGAAIDIPWLEEATVTYTTSSTSYYADNVTENSTTRVTGAEIELVVSSNMSPELLAQLTGKKYNKASVSTTANDKSPSYALAYEILMDDDSVRRYVIYNCNLRKEENSNTTVSDSIDAKTYTLLGTAKPLVSSKEIDLEMDSKEVAEYVADTNNDAADIAAVQNAWNQFFTTVARQVA